MSPLRARAWAFQERLLIRCILYLTRYGMEWECNECIADKFNQRGILFLSALELRAAGEKRNKPILKDAERPVKESIQLNVFKEFFSTMNLAANKGSECLTPESAFHFDWLWAQLISEYSSGALTFEADRLVAIAGVASQIESRTGFTYVAGLWKEFLHYNLLWGLRSPWSGEWHPPTYQAPSWSWASVIGQVGRVASNCLDGSGLARDHRVPPLACDQKADVVDIQIEKRRNQIPNGEILNAHLTMRGPLLKVEHLMMKLKTNSWYIYGHGHGFIGRCFPDVFPLSSSPESDWYCLRIMRLTTLVPKRKRH